MRHGNGRRLERGETVAYVNYFGAGQREQTKTRVSQVSLKLAKTPTQLVIMMVAKKKLIRIKKSMKEVWKL